WDQHIGGRPAGAVRPLRAQRPRPLRRHRLDSRNDRRAATSGRSGDHGVQRPPQGTDGRSRYLRGRGGAGGDGRSGAVAVLCERVSQAVGVRRQESGVRMAKSNPLSYLGEQLETWRAEGTYQRLRVLESESAAEARFDGRDVINLASNNYLGLTTHPKLREAALEAVHKFGVGSGAVRTISGTMSLHMQLEERIAAFKNVEACVVFQSGFAANAGTVSAIL